jgi:toxin-antitoxin system PIN domain toxin
VISFDTNLLFPALERSHRDHATARSFLDGLGGTVALSELVLMELYVLVRNPLVCRRPLGPGEAVSLVEQLRTGTRWRLLDAPEGLMAEVWRRAADPGFGRRRIFDARLAVSLVRQGVTRFATRNVADFRGCGFAEVFDPLASR